MVIGSRLRLRRRLMLSQPNINLFGTQLDMLRLRGITRRPLL